MRFREKLQLLDLIAKKDPSNYWKAAGHLAQEDYWFYLRFVLDYRFLDPWDHGEEMVHFFEENLGNPMMFMVPRGGGKSSIISIPAIPWFLARDPMMRWMVVNARADRAKAMGKQMAGILTSERYRNCFPWISPGTKWGEGGYYLEPVDKQGNPVLGRIDASISMYGVGGNVTGSHVGGILVDDIINEATYDSPSELEKAHHFLRELFNCLDPGGQFLTSCTRWSFNDPYGKLESGEYLVDGKKVRTFKRKAERFVLDEKDVPVKQRFNNLRKYQDENGNWKSVGYSQEFLDGQKKTLGSLYWALFHNEPTNGEDRLFEFDMINEFFSPPFEEIVPAKVGIEVNSQAVAFYPVFTQMMRESGRRFSVEKLTAPTKGKGGMDVSKHSRIRSVIQPVMNYGRLWVREDIMRKPGSLGTEIREFDKGDDDALDALHWAMLKAPRHAEGQPVRPYIALDPAWTDNPNSDSSAIVVGAWWYDDFYVLDCHKFKTTRIEAIAQQLFRFYDKWSSVTAMKAKKINPPSVRRFVSAGNGSRRRSNHPFGNPSIWGDGMYTKADEDA